MRYLILIVAMLAGCQEPAEDPKPVPKPVPVDFVTPNPLIPPAPTPIAKPKATPTPFVKGNGEDIADRARTFIGTVEKPGNRGKLIDEWNTRADVPMGSPYCGSFAGAMHADVGVPPPKGYAYTPSWFVKSKTIPWTRAQRGDVVGFYYPGKGRIAHIGILDAEPEGSFTRLVEANTSYDAKAGSASDRDGDGVHAKLRNTKILQQSNNQVARYW
jgi:hypothetical protein